MSIRSVSVVPAMVRATEPGIASFHIGTNVVAMATGASPDQACWEAVPKRDLKQSLTGVVCFRTFRGEREPGTIVDSIVACLRSHPDRRCGTPFCGCNLLGPNSRRIPPPFQCGRDLRSRLLGSRPPTLCCCNTLAHGGRTVPSDESDRLSFAMALRCIRSFRDRRQATTSALAKLRHRYIISDGWV